MALVMDAGRAEAILSTACSVAPRVEPWKLEMLVDIADEHGRYSQTGPS
jgi:uroporphyrinogen-III decarboxylase